MSLCPYTYLSVLHVFVSVSEALLANEDPGPPLFLVV